MNELIIAGSDKIDLEVFKGTSTLSDEDKKKVREFGKLKKAKEDLQKQIGKIDLVIDTIDAGWCRKYLWTSAAGDVSPLFDIDDDYLKNIVSWSQKNYDRVSKEVKKEYYARFGYNTLIDVEESKYAPKKKEKKARKMYDYEFEDDENW